MARIAAWAKATLPTPSVNPNVKLPPSLNELITHGPIEAVVLADGHAFGPDWMCSSTARPARPVKWVNVIFANEKVRPAEPEANPDVVPSESMGTFTAPALASLVQVKLTAFRDKDRTHLRDRIDVGLIDATWPGRFVPELGRRLHELLDTPGA